MRRINARWTSACAFLFAMAIGTPSALAGGGLSEAFNNMNPLLMLLLMILAVPMYILDALLGVFGGGL